MPETLTKLENLNLERLKMAHELNGLDLEVRADDPDKAAKLERRVALEGRLQTHDTALIAAWESEGAARSDAGEVSELAEIRARVDVSKYVMAAVERRGLSGGPELEYNAAMGVAGDGFPMSLLDIPAEERAAIAADGQTNQQTWIDRVFGESAAQRVGVTFRSVAPGVASVPAITAGATGAQRGNPQAAANATYTVGITELKPKRNAVHTIFSIQDSMRVPGLEEAITRDLRGAVVDAVDKAVFLGDSGANPNDGDIVGLVGLTPSDVETDVTQANKITAPGVLAAFAAQLDGKYATGLADLRVVLAVGAARLWTATVPNAATGNNASIAQTLNANGITWQIREGIEDNTANGDFLAFIGRARGIDGAAVAAVWENGSLIRDPYTDADSGEVRLTLNYLGDFQVPRTANFRRLKAVT